MTIVFMHSRYPMGWSYGQLPREVGAVDFDPFKNRENFWH